MMNSEALLHDPRVMALPQPIRVDACAGGPHDTAVFQHLGVWERLQPWLGDATTPTEALINDLPWMRPVTNAYLQLLGEHNLGSFILTMHRARLRAHGDPVLEVTPALQTLLDQTDVEAGLPVRCLEPPEPMVYLRLAPGNGLQVPNRVSGLHECEGAYLARYTLPAGGRGAAGGGGTLGTGGEAAGVRQVERQASGAVGAGL